MCSGGLYPAGGLKAAAPLGLQTVSTLRLFEEAVAAQHHAAVDDGGAPAAAHTTATQHGRTVEVGHMNGTNERSGG